MNEKVLSQSWKGEGCHVAEVGGVMHAVREEGRRFWGLGS